MRVKSKAAEMSASGARMKGHRQDSPAPAPICVSIVEDEAWLREHLACEINRSPALRCVGAYRTAEEALKAIPAARPDVVIVDINLPGIDGVECVRRLKAELPQTQCLMLTVYEEDDKIFNSLRAGASGYLLKRSNTPELLEAIQQVHSGGAPLSCSIARKVVHYFNQASSAPEMARLSPREREVLEGLAKGESYKEIAERLSLAVETIRMNVKHIYSKLHVHSRGEATAMLHGQDSAARR
jgi:DNA-binding NarL/FixJ family response regulator